MQRYWHHNEIVLFMDTAFLFQIGDSQSSLAIMNRHIPADEGRIAGMEDEALGGTIVY